MDPSQRRRRAAHRHQVPLNSAGINAELRLDGQTVHHGVVWDLSSAGACLLLKVNQALDPGVLMHLTLYPSIGVGELTMAVASCWSQMQGNQCFIGLSLRQPRLLQGSFLDRYLSAIPSMPMAA